MTQRDLATALATVRERSIPQTLPRRSPLGNRNWRLDDLPTAITI
jgi:hypothetical protein